MNKKIVHSVFENIATQYPENIAVQNETAQIDYKSLNEFSNGVAHLLKELGIEKGAPVGILMPNGISYVAAVLGVNKAAAVFVPLETAHPPKRTKVCIENVGIEFLITTPEQLVASQEWLDEIACLANLILIKGENNGQLELTDQAGDHYPYQLSKADPALTVEADDPVYILHTSGSTGTPKAIVGRHKSLSHFIHWEMNEFGINSQDAVSQLATVSFDVSLRDIFVPLLSGGRLCIPSEETRKNPLKLLKWMGGFGITLSHMVPSIFRLLIDELNADKAIKTQLKSLKYILLAGEPLYAEDVNSWRTVAGPEVELVNLYGPTETTLAKIFNRIKSVPPGKRDIVSLGKPISNTAILILNNGKLCDVGQPGEICIKTPFRSLGYLDNDAMNSEKFVQNPLHDEYEDIIYYTGDIGRYNSNREVEFITRKDDQVKIMGNRVELREVTAALEEIKGLKQPFVVAGKDAGNNLCLICYLLKNDAFDETYVREELKHHLPIYMYPAHFVAIDEYPTTLSGKIDKKSLPKPYLTVEQLYDEPVGEMEKKLEAIWCDILGVSRVSRGASFFNLGGSSLKAIQIISKVQKEFNVLIEIAELFSLATIESLAAAIENSGQSVAFKLIPKVGKQEYYELSHSQRRIMFMEMMDDSNKSNIIDNIYQIEGNFQVKVLERAMNQLVTRHEILRTIFVEHEGDFKLRVLSPDTPYEILVTHADTDGDEAQIINEWTDRVLATKFALDKLPLIKIEVLQLANNRSLLSIIAHHIIFDGWSSQIFRSEILQLYHAELSGTRVDLPELKIQYKDYAAWQNKQLQSKENKSADYWKQQFEEEVERLDLQNKHPRPAILTFKGADRHFKLNEQLTKKLKDISEANEATLFMTLFTILNVLINKYAAKDDIVIGTPIAGRAHEDLNNQIGAFINILALRMKVTQEDTLTELLQQAKAVTNAAYEHQSYPFDYLIDVLDLPKDLSRSPLFDVMIVLYEQVKQETLPSQDDMSIDFFDKTGDAGKYDLNFEFVEADNEIQLKLKYNPDLFTTEFAENLGKSYLKLAEIFADRQRETVEKIEVLAEKAANELIEAGRGPEVTVPFATVIERFHEVVEKDHGRVAVEVAGESITYGELNFKANQLAAALTQSGVKAGDVVATHLAPSIELVIAILAIFKANATLLPLDPNDPLARNQFKVTKSDTHTVVGDSEQSHLEGLTHLNVKAISSVAADFSYQRAPADLTQYILFTSGSSGEPKAVKVGVKGFANYIHWANDYFYNGTSGFDCGIVSAFTFDFTFEPFMATLTRGDKLHIYEAQDLSADLQDLFFGAHHIKTAKLTPSHIAMLDLSDAQNTSIEKLVVGGEALTTAHCEKVNRIGKDITIYNNYGPTEATIACTTSTVTNSNEVTIGKPINNMEAYVLDEQGKLLPRGAAGELYVAGRGVAQGYLKDEAQTAEKFVKLPFTDHIAYRTGDLCRWNDQDELIYLTRLDGQVKINGVRVELSEIHSTILSHDLVVDAVVTTAATQDRGILVAGFTGDCTAKELRNYLVERLPINMIPAVLRNLEEIPLTTNGKADLKQIKQLAREEVVVEKVAPKTPIEVKLAKMWEDVLEVEDIGLNEVFFEIGGQSIKAAQLKVRILKEFGLDLALTIIFRKPTVGMLAAEIEALNWASNKAANVSNTKELII